MSIVTRFAPSPTGLMHLGHAYSALMAYEFAKRHKGRFFLRIEDIDTTRARPEFIQAIFDDLKWLGIDWPEPVWRQSERMSIYSAALDKLKQKGLMYRCFCTRKQIQAEIQAAGGAPHGPDGVIYPGTCRDLPEDVSKARAERGETHAWRLDMTKAIQAVTGPLVWHDLEKGDVIAKPERFGDVVLARKETPTSYHLSVTVDDAVQGVTHIIRGVDLFDHTDVHVLLQRLMELTTPIYLHHKLIMDEKGERLAKRRLSKSIQSIRDSDLKFSCLTDLLNSYNKI